MKLLSPHTHHPLALLICIFSSELASAYVTIPWQTSRYYGFDGPWQAVKANVGGFATGPSASLQWTSVDLLPGGTGGCFIPTGRLCEHNASGLCGIGGTWTPATEPVEVGSGTRFEQLVEPAVNSTGLSMHGDWQVQNLNIGGQGRLLLPAYTIPNVGLVAVTGGSIILPNGTTTDIELGTFSLGANNASEILNDIDQAWTVSDWLYKQGLIKSNSFGLHIGSAAFNYSGSLLLGGFDQGRAIGFGIQFFERGAHLMDITMGVESGPSPYDGFRFDNKLLNDDSSRAGRSIYAVPEPLAPYLYLPRATCAAIASRLPVTYDAALGYYFWNTADPAYLRITTSPAWLGFNFETWVEDYRLRGSQITIKVPFALLTLNLTYPALPRPTDPPRPYFPCMPYTPRPDVAGGQYLLGRAFLQAALLIHIRDRPSWWLVQAPGPGDPATRAGLGAQGVDIPAGSMGPTLLAHAYEKDPPPSFSSSPAAMVAVAVLPSQQEEETARETARPLQIPRTTR